MKLGSDSLAPMGEDLGRALAPRKLSLSQPTLFQCHAAAARGRKKQRKSCSRKADRVNRENILS